MEAELLAAIHAAPDDDGPRLVYADWLAARDPARAEWIQLDCMVKQLDDDDDRYPGIQRRLSELFAAHGKRWLGEFPALPHVRAVLRRGFVEGVAGRGAELCALGDRVATTWPLAHVVEVQLDDRGDVLELAPAQVLAITRELRLNGEGRNVGFGALGSVAALARLERLEIWSLAVAPADVEAIVTSPHLGALRVLHIANARYLRRALAGLARATVPLDELELPATHGGAELGAALLAAPGIRCLRRLALPGAELDGPSLAALADAGKLDDVEHLDLRGNLIDCAALEALLRRPQTRLTRLKLGGNRGLGDRGAALLAGWPGAANLVTLHVGGCGIEAAGARALAASPFLTGLRKLVMNGAELGAGVEAELLASPHLAQARIYVGSGAGVRLLGRKAAAEAARKAGKASARGAKARPA